MTSRAVFGLPCAIALSTIGCGSNGSNDASDVAFGPLPDAIVESGADATGDDGRADVGDVLAQVGDVGDADGDRPIDRCGECRTPPASICEGDALRVHEPVGTCDEGGSCRYASRLESCAHGCEASACKDDPCRGKVCDAPDAPTCKDSTTLRTFEAAGTCTAGACTYAPREVRCEFGCDAGACKEDPCKGKSCDKPPPAACKDATTLRAFDPAGTCGAGECTYAAREIACDFGCEAGACKGDPCAGKVCRTPEAPTCKDARTLRTFDPTGTCSAGACRYEEREIACEFGCENGACKGDPCAGKVCNAPDPASCKDATTLVTHDPSGTCTAGACSYRKREIACAFGCEKGACKDDPCIGKVCRMPDAPRCKDARTLRTFEEEGRCASGACVYAEKDVPCAFGCEAGACKADPCAGKVCQTAPASSCIDPNTLRTFDAVGTCNAGSCSYGERKITCAHGCEAGACKDDPCKGVVCTQPDAARCKDDRTAVTFAPVGVCRRGACEYVSTESRCEFGCEAGTCRASCGDGRHACDGRCLPDDAVESCGLRCTPCPAPPANAVAVCRAASCGFECNPGWVRVGAACRQVDAPRPIAPGSTTFVTSRRPTFRWEPAPGTDGAQIEICEDRACATRLLTAKVTGIASFTPATNLPQGSLFFRLRSMAGGNVGENTSPVWHFVVPPRSATVSTTHGRIFDADGDGIADLLLAENKRCADGTAQKQLHRGSSSGLSTTSTALCGLSGDPILAGDVDGDGYGDLFVQTWSPNEVQVYFGGPQPSSRRIATNRTPFGIGDLDGDGFADLALTDSGIQIRLGSKLGITGTAYEMRPQADEKYLGIGEDSLVTGDFDGDGRLDLAVTSDNYLSVFLNDGAWPRSPLLVRASQRLPFRTPFGAKVYAVGDVDGDGRADVVVVDDGAAGSAALFRGSPSGLVRDWTVAIPNVSAVRGGDLDGDGFSDFVILAGGSQASVFLSRGAAGPSATPTKVIGVSALRVASGDFSGSGVVDLVFTRNINQVAPLFVGGLGGPTLVPTTTIAVTDPNGRDARHVLGSLGL
jgi:hypothetical protein